MKIFAKIGTMNMGIGMSTSVAKVNTTVGNTIAPFTRRFSFVSFSIWSATRSRTLSEHSRGLAGLHHRHVELVEHLRVAGHRLREEEAAFDIGAELA